MYVGGKHTALNDCMACSALSDAVSVYTEANEYTYRQCDGDEDSVYCRSIGNVWFLANRQAQECFPKGSYNPFGAGISRTCQSYTKESIHDVIKKYVNLADINLIPEYGNNDVDNGKVIAGIRSNYPQYTENFIRVVMYNLEDGVKNNIVMPLLLKPKTYHGRDLSKDSESIKTLEKFKAPEDDDPMKKIITALKWTGGIAIAGLAIYGVKVGVEAVKTVKS